uniref:Uncharacterized protein n=1 Tax=Anguilla anguilla TaxID=7936 RepID=A0A0E9PMU6_ANGAN
MSVDLQLFVHIFEVFSCLFVGGGGMHLGKTTTEYNCICLYVLSAC